jgi:hypothetical protein
MSDCTDAELYQTLLVDALRELAADIAAIDSACALQETAEPVGPRATPASAAAQARLDKKNVKNTTRGAKLAAKK